MFKKNILKQHPGYIILIFIAIVLYITFNSSPVLEDRRYIEFKTTRPEEASKSLWPEYFSTDNEIVKMTNWLEYLEDPDGNLDLNNILSGKYDSLFKTVEEGKEVKYFPYDTMKSVWIRFQVKSFCIKQKYLIGTRFRGLIMEYYMPDGVGGYRKYFRSMSKGNREFVEESKVYVSFPLVYDDNQTFYIKMTCRPHKRILLDFFLRTNKNYINENTREVIGKSIYFGFLLMFLLYHLFLYFSVKDKRYLYFALFVLSLLMFRLEKTGFLTWRLWGDNFQVRQCIFIFFHCFACISGILFVRINLTLKKRIQLRTILDRIANIFIIAVLIYLPIAMILYLPFTIQNLFTVTITSISLAVGLGYIIISLMEKDKIAVYYIIAFIPFIALNFLQIFVKPVYFFLQNFSPHISLDNLCDIYWCTILAVTIGLRINELKKDKGSAQRKIIEQERQIRENLLNEKDRLEIWVKERTAELCEARQEAEQANTAKSQFIANVSHELRTPLGGIIGFAELIAFSKTDKEKTDYANKILKESEHLLSLLTDILDLSKIESGKLDVECIPFNLVEVLSNSLAGNELQIIKKGLKYNKNLAANLPEWVKGDPVKIKQVMLNLINNAYKFTRSGSISVNVNISDENKDPVELYFEVKDTGIGISKKQQLQIFKSFVQADMRITREYGGTGLGTTISKMLIELMGGEIGFKSTEGKGSTFWFRIPLQKYNHVDIEDAFLDKEIAFIDEKTKKGKILIVDDYPPNREISKKWLSSFGYTVIIADSGEGALQKCKKDVFSLILMDIQMPVLDGYETSKRIRSECRKNKDTPIIALTAGGFQGEKQKCMEAGMQDCILKPFKHDNAREIIDRWIYGKKAGVFTEELEDKQALKNKEIPIAYYEFIKDFKDNRDADTILKGFIREGENLIKDMKNALDSTDFKILHREAHTLKGGAMNIMAAPLQEAAQQLEKELKNPNSKDKNRYLSLFYLVEEAFSELKGFISRLPG